MFKELSQQLYGYIIQAEMILLDVYKLDPWDVMKHMSMMDLQFYMKRIENDWKRKKDNFKKKDLLEVLQKVNELLTWIFHKK